MNIPIFRLYFTFVTVEVFHDPFLTGQSRGELYLLCYSYQRQSQKPVSPIVPLLTRYLYLDKWSLTSLLCNICVKAGLFTNRLLIHFQKG